MKTSSNLQNTLTNKTIQNTNYINNSIPYTKSNSDISSISDIKQNSNMTIHSKVINENTSNINSNHTGDSNDKNNNFVLKKGVYIFQV